MPMWSSIILRACGRNYQHHQSGSSLRESTPGALRPGRQGAERPGGRAQLPALRARFRLPGDGVLEPWIGTVGIPRENLVFVRGREARRVVHVTLGVVEILSAPGVDALDRTDHFGGEQNI